MMRLSTEQRSSDWWLGAELTTSASVLRKQRKWLWILEELLRDLLLLFASKEHLYLGIYNQQLYFLRRQKRAGLGNSVLISFYRGALESILTSSLTVLFGNCSATDKKALQWVVKSAQRITGSSFPTVEDIYSSGCRDRAASIIKGSSHPGNRLFTPLPSERRLCAIRPEQLGSGTAFFLRLFDL